MISASKGQRKADAFPSFVLSIHQSAIPENGEDSYCYSFCEAAGIMGVFDGCGGLGARQHAFYSGKTEAFMASRLCAGAFYDRFQDMPPAILNSPERFQTEYIKFICEYCPDVLRLCKPPVSDAAVTLRGSMVKTLPTTAAAVLIQPSSHRKEIRIHPIWAGDSRAYLLDADGLAQLTYDDSTVSDPQENLYEDGILRNILCEGKPPRLHTSEILVNSPVLVFAATDGCFGYFSTPMEFEGFY